MNLWKVGTWTVVVCLMARPVSEACGSCGGSDTQDMFSSSEGVHGGGCDKVETALFERIGGEDPNGPGAGDEAGWSKLKFECESIDEGAALETEAKLKYGAALSLYAIYIKVNGESMLFADAIETDDEGEGEWEMDIDVTSYVTRDLPEDIDVQVVVKPAGSQVLDGYATDTVLVPVCGCDDEAEGEGDPEDEEKGREKD